jgi:hypothetical protein
VTPKADAFRHRLDGSLTRIPALLKDRVERNERQPAGDFLLILRVDILGIADIDRDRVLGVRQSVGHRLRFAQFRPLALPGLFPGGQEIRQLHNQ